MYNNLPPHISSSPVVLSWHMRPCIIWPHFTFPIVCVSCDHSIAIFLDRNLVGFFSHLCPPFKLFLPIAMPFSMFMYPNSVFLFLHVKGIYSMKTCLTLSHKRQCKWYYSKRCALFSLCIILLKTISFFSIVHNWILSVLFLW